MTAAPRANVRRIKPSSLAAAKAAGIVVVGMGGGTGQHVLHFLAPPDQLGTGQHGVAAFIDHIIDLAAKRIQSGNG